MIAIIHDTWRAVLVVAVAVLLREVLAGRPVAPAAPAAWQQPAPAWQPAQPWPTPPVATGAWQPVPAPAVETRGPIRRVARELVDLSEAVLGVVR
jgi:hypothetical protein